MLTWTSRTCAFAIALAGTLLPGRATALDPIVFTVNTTDDGVDAEPGNGKCSITLTPTPPYICTLRAAIMEANRTPPGATIVVPAGHYTITINPHDADGEDNGDLNLSIPSGYGPGPTTITGAGAATTIIDATGRDRALSVDVDRTASISGVTVTNGLVPSGNGGGIYCAGTLTLSHVTLSGNTASILNGEGGAIYNSGVLRVSYSTVNGNNKSSYGGGIYNEGNLTLDHSTVSGNTASSGGGIANLLTGDTTVSQSTISGNTATYGGGVFNQVALLEVTNSTISSNSADFSGGGIDNIGDVEVYNSTIVDNQAPVDNTSAGTGSGLDNEPGYMFNLHNSVVAGNYYIASVAGTPVYNDCTGDLGFYGNNKFWNTVGCTAAPGSSGTVSLLLSLAELGILQDNGGPTWTVAIVAPSDMIDGGDATTGCVDDMGTMRYDQRGFPRIAGARCDIGAFEYGIIFANDFDL